MSFESSAKKAIERAKSDLTQKAIHGVAKSKALEGKKGKIDKKAWHQKHGDYPDAKPGSDYMGAR